MTATRKGDTHSLLLLLQLLRFNIKNTDRNKNKKNTVAEKWGVMWKNHYYENESATTDFYAFNRKQNVGCWKFSLSHNIGSN